MSINTVIFG